MDWGKLISTGIDIVGHLMGPSSNGAQQGAAPAPPPLQVGSNAALAAGGYVPPGMGGPAWPASPYAQYATPQQPAYGAGGVPSYLAPEAAPPTMRSAEMASPYAVPGAPPGFNIPAPGQAGPANYAGTPFAPNPYAVPGAPPGFNIPGPAAAPGPANYANTPFAPAAGAAPPTMRSPQPFDMFAH